MNHQHNELVALEWLIAPLNEKIDALHAYEANEISAEMSHIASEYQAIGGVLTMANLSKFTQLAKLITTTAEYISKHEKNAELIPRVLYASRLLQHELNYYALTGFLREHLIDLRISYLLDLLRQYDVELECSDEELQSSIEIRFSKQIAIDLPPFTSLSDEEYQKISDEWRIFSDQLIHLGQGSDGELTTLKNNALRLAGVAQDDLLQKLWLIVALWFESLKLNDEAIFDYYASMLSDLNDVIALQKNGQPIQANQVVWIENLLTDIYISLANLDKVSEDSVAVLDRLNDKLSGDQPFFMHVLSVLEGMIYSLADGKIDLEVLTVLQQQLANRGWSFYASYVEQIIVDVKQALEDADKFAQMHWQINTQLQDLYGTISNTHEVIETKVGISTPAKTEAKQAHDKDTLREIRILVEEIKNHFTNYLHSKKPEDLPEHQGFDQLALDFKDMGLYDVVDISEKIAGLFDVLQTKAPERISWQLTHKIADGLSLFEMFLDSLAQEIFEDKLLKRAETRVNDAITMLVEMGELEDMPEIFDLDAKILDARKNTVLYDDEGEHVPQAVVDEQEQDEEEIIIVDAQSDEQQVQVASEVNEEDKKDESNASVEQIQAEDTQEDEVAQEADTSQETPIIQDQEQVNESEDDVATDLADGQLSEEYLAAKASLKEDDFSYDEEFREIFIEEVDEVMEEMQANLEKWQEDITDFTTLKEIRRGFHTLKGSGRMVGAFQVGETAWAIENMLNRVLDNTIKVVPDVATLVTQTASIIPEMVADFSQQKPPSFDNAIIVLKANNLLKGKPLESGVPVSELTEAVESDLATDVATNETHQEVEADVVDVTSEDVEVSDGGIVLPEVLTIFMEEASQPLISTITDVDEDIKEIFIEEADEVLTDIAPMFASWLSDKTQRALLVDIRRGFHTLKGSGRMVGAVELGELAWSIENMLNRVLDNTIVMNEGMCALVSDVIADFDKLVKLFDNNVSVYPQQVVLWIACAHAYSKGHGDEFDYRIFSSFVRNKGVDWSLTVDEEIAQKFEDKQGVQNRPSIEALNSIQEAGALISNATLQTPHDEEEELLCEIFIEEARELLGEIKAFLSKHGKDVEVAVNDDVVRVFHTMRGASGLPPLVAVSEVSTMIERSLQGLQQHEAMMTPKHLQALGNAVELIEAHLDAYENTNSNAHQTQQEIKQAQEFEEDKQVLETLLSDTPQQSNTSNIESMIEGIDTLLDAELDLEDMATKEVDEVAPYAQTQLQEIDLLSSRTTNLPKFQSLLATLKPAYELLAEHPIQASDDKFIDALLAVHHELIGLFDSLAGSMSLRVDKAVLGQLSSITAEREAYHAALGKELKEEVSAEQAEQELIIEEAEEAVVTPVRFEEISTDDELLQIFLEEASELDDEVTKAFVLWREDKDNIEHLKLLQRHLHTIKGGARLAGISSIGDLTHEAESVYEKFTNGQMKVSDAWLTTMQRVQDVLSLQLDAVKNHKQSFFADDTIEDLRQYLAAGEVPEGALIRIPVFDDEQEVADDEQEVQEEVVATDESEQFKAFITDSWHGEIPDDDILDVFLEEAKELAESSSEDFAAFRNNTSDLASLQALQRKLHTIKGGARMVSANGVADIAHEMETVYENLGNRRRPATRMIANLLFACHDWITTAVGLLQDKYNPPRPTPLIDALHKFIANPDSLTAVPPLSLEQELKVIADYKEFEASRKNARDISHMPPVRGVFGESVETSNSTEMIRISAPLMERMINLSGEAAINRARIDMNLASVTVSIEEMGVTVQRLADQLRRMDIELEAQILAQIDDASILDAGFDPLEMDQYSSLNQLSKSLSESASDLLDIKATLLEKTRDGENLLLQLSRTQAELQDSLMNSRMVPFSRLTPRLQRIIRQTSSELGKSVDLTVINGDGEMDRSILDRITSPLEHMLRNAVDHGIELPERRSQAGKPAMGHVTLEIQREGGEMVLLLSDDGAGINTEAVRKKAIAQGLIQENDKLSDNDIMQYIFNAGLSTTSKVTQISGRGVGMDVVRTEIRQLGGSVSVESELGKGSRFIIRVPLTVAVADALIVRVADRQYAVPLVQIERVLQVNAKELLAYHQSDKTTMNIDGKEYRLRYLNEILTDHYFNEIVASTSLPVLIIKSQTGQSLAVQVDEIVGSRMEIVVKPLGRQLSHLSGVTAATIMGDGSVMLILDLIALMRTAQKHVTREVKAQNQAKRRNLIMVVDDSVTVRKVTTRFLERQGFEVVVAKDGIDAIEILQDTVPDLMLLDIEMPRMDGFEVATQVRHNNRLKDLFIIMITSRTGEKHRERAFEIGVNDYMGKPFQEIDLLSRINTFLGLDNNA